MENNLAKIWPITVAIAQKNHVFMLMKSRSGSRDIALMLKLIPISFLIDINIAEFYIRFHCDVSVFFTHVVKPSF